MYATYRDDFNKYCGRLPHSHLDDVLTAVPHMLANKFVYRQVNKHAQSKSIKRALDLLSQARICHLVHATHANGVPLAAEKHYKATKVILLDVGLVSAALGLNLHYLTQLDDLNLVNQGGLSEQVVGQLLRTLTPYYVEPALYYWLREKKYAAAEIDYVIQHNHQVIPIEVKSGSSGSLKSLHQFMFEKDRQIAVRVNADHPSFAPVDVGLGGGQRVNYNLLSIPFYLIGQLPRLLDSINTTHL